MRYGFTTGSCATAATKAAIQMYLGGYVVDYVNINTPAGKVFKAQIEDIKRTPDFVSCAVKKYAGDDPDVTNGIYIYSKVEVLKRNVKDTNVSISGGEGIGIVTKPGLDQPVGNFAINSTPREMIKEAVLEVCREYDVALEVQVTIYCPEGLQVAKKTFNPKLGIEGGISIIGTSGVVIPMSNDAIIETIKLELKQKRQLGHEYAVIAFGNYGLNFLKDTYGYDTESVVKCSNFIGETIDSVVELGYKGFLLCGHIGKLIKVAGGAMNTHSSVSDNRIKVLEEIAMECGADKDTSEAIHMSLTTTQGLNPIKEAGLLKEVSERIVEKAILHMDNRAGGLLNIECILFENENGILAQSKGALKWLTS